MSHQGTMGEFAEALGELAQRIHLSRMAEIDHSELINCVHKWFPGIIIGEQEDANQFLSTILSFLTEDLNTASPNKEPDFSSEDPGENAWKAYVSQYSGIIVSTFGGQMASTITCMHCHTKKKNYDTFTQVTLPLQTADYINFEYK